MSVVYGNDDKGRYKTMYLGGARFYDNDFGARERAYQKKRAKDVERVNAEKARARKRDKQRKKEEAKKQAMKAEDDLRLQSKRESRMSKEKEDSSKRIASNDKRKNNIRNLK